MLRSTPSYFGINIVAVILLIAIIRMIKRETEAVQSGSLPDENQEAENL